MPRECANCASRQTGAEAGPAPQRGRIAPRSRNGIPTRSIRPGRSRGPDARAQGLSPGHG